MRAYGTIRRVWEQSPYRARVGKPGPIVFLMLGGLLAGCTSTIKDATATYRIQVGSNGHGLDQPPGTQGSIQRLIAFRTGLWYARCASNLVRRAMNWQEPTLRDLVAEIEDVAANAARTLEPDALAQVLAFLTKVAHVLDQAYRDVIPVLIEIKYAPKRLDQKSLDKMRQQIELLSARSRYRDAEEICSRLSTLRRVYESNINSLIDAERHDRWAGLFGLIEEREGRIIMLIQSQLRQLLKTFDQIEQGGGQHDLRGLVTPSIKEITAQVAELNDFTNRILGLSGEPGLLEMLRDPATARSVVQQLTVFDRRQYVEHNYKTGGKNSPIIGAGARVTGGVSNTTIGSMDLSALARELAELRAAMDQMSTGKAEQSIAVGKIAEAEIAATKGDPVGVNSALKSAGKWTLGVAEKIGVGLVVAALK